MQHAIAGASDDAVAAHYAAKTLENIFTASLSAPQGSLPDSLGHADSLSLLLRLAASTAALEGLRSTAACAASHLLRIRPELGVAMLHFSVSSRSQKKRTPADLLNAPCVPVST